MDLHIPDDPEYQWAYTAILIASGENLPKADIAQLRQMTGELGAVVSAMLALSGGMGGISTSVAGAVSGKTAREFHNATREVTNGVPEDINLLLEMINQADNFSLDAEHTQYTVAIAMFLTVFDIFLALVSGFPYLVPLHIGSGGSVVRSLLQGLKLRHAGQGLKKLPIPPVPKGPPKGLGKGPGPQPVPKPKPEPVPAPKPKVEVDGPRPNPNPKPEPKPEPKAEPTPQPLPKDAPKPKDTPPATPKDTPPVKGDPPAPAPKDTPPMSGKEQAGRYVGEIVQEAGQEAVQEVAEDGGAMVFQMAEGNRKSDDIDWDQLAMAAAGGAMIGGVATAWAGALKKIAPGFSDNINGRAINDAIGEVLGELGFTSIVGGDFNAWATVTSSMLASYGVDLAGQAGNSLGGVPEGGPDGGNKPNPDKINSHFDNLISHLESAGGGQFDQVIPVIDNLRNDLLNGINGQPLGGPGDVPALTNGADGAPPATAGGGPPTSTDGPANPAATVGETPAGNPAVNPDGSQTGNPAANPDGSQTGTPGGNAGGTSAGVTTGQGPVPVEQPSGAGGSATAPGQTGGPIPPDGATGTAGATAGGAAVNAGLPGFDTQIDDGTVTGATPAQPSGAADTHAPASGDTQSSTPPAANPQAANPQAAAPQAATPQGSAPQSGTSGPTGSSTTAPTDGVQTGTTPSGTSPTAPPAASQGTATQTAAPQGATAQPGTGTPTGEATPPATGTSTSTSSQQTPAVQSTSTQTPAPQATTQDTVTQSTTAPQSQASESTTNPVTAQSGLPAATPTGAAPQSGGTIAPTAATATSTASAPATTQSQTSTQSQTTAPTQSTTQGQPTAPHQSTAPQAPTAPTKDNVTGDSTVLTEAPADGITSTPTSDPVPDTESPPAYTESDNPPVYEAVEAPPPAYGESAQGAATPNPSSSPAGGDPKQRTGGPETGARPEPRPRTANPETPGKIRLVVTGPESTRPAGDRKTPITDTFDTPALAVWSDDSSDSPDNAPVGPVYTDSGLQLLSPSDVTNKRHADALPNGKGYLVAGHGHANAMNAGGREYTPAEVASMIKADPKWQASPTGPIRLLSCDTGRQFANDLARHFPGVPVVAPLDTVWTDSNGNVFVAPKTYVDGKPRPAVSPPATDKWIAVQADLGPDETTTDTESDTEHDARTDDTAAPETVAERPVSTVRTFTQSHMPGTTPRDGPGTGAVDWAMGLEIEGRKHQLLYAPHGMSWPLDYNTVVLRHSSGNVEVKVDGYYARDGDGKRLKDENGDTLPKVSIGEVVSTPFKVFSREDRPDRATVRDLNAEANRRLDGLAEGERKSLSELFPESEGWQVTPEGKDVTVLGRNLNPKNSDPYTQYTVGVPLAGATKLLQHVATNSPSVATDGALRSRRGVLEDGIAVADQVRDLYRSWAGDSARDLDAEQIAGAIALMYPHAAAMAYKQVSELAGQPDRMMKSYLAVASRAAPAALNAALSISARGFLAAHTADIHRLVDQRLGGTLTDPAVTTALRDKDLLDDDGNYTLTTVEVDEVGATTGEYLDNALLGGDATNKVDQGAFLSTHFSELDDNGGRLTDHPLVQVEIRNLAAHQGMDLLEKNTENLTAVLNDINDNVPAADRGRLQEQLTGVANAAAAAADQATRLHDGVAALPQQHREVLESARQTVAGTQDQRDRAEQIRDQSWDVGGDISNRVVAAEAHGRALDDLLNSARQRTGGQVTPEVQRLADLVAEHHAAVEQAQDAGRKAGAALGSASLAAEESLELHVRTNRDLQLASVLQANLEVLGTNAQQARSRADQFTAALDRARDAVDGVGTDPKRALSGLRQAGMAAARIKGLVNDSRTVIENAGWDGQGDVGTTADDIAAELTSLQQQIQDKAAEVSGAQQDFRTAENSLSTHLGAADSIRDQAEQAAQAIGPAEQDSDSRSDYGSSDYGDDDRSDDGDQPGGSARPISAADFAANPWNSGSSSIWNSPDSFGALNPAAAQYDQRSAPDAWQDDPADWGGPDTTADAAVTPPLPAPSATSRSTAETPTCGDPIDITTGRMIYTETDLVLPGLTLERTYRSDYHWGRSFGVGWASTLDQRIHTGERHTHFFAADGSIRTYETPAEGAESLPLLGTAMPLRRLVGGGWLLTSPDGLLVFGPAQTSGDALLCDVVTGTTRWHLFRDSDDTPTHLESSAGDWVDFTTAGGLVTGGWFARDGDRFELPAFGYDDRRQLVEIRNSSGDPVRLRYDDAGRIVRWDDRNGEWYSYTYDEAGRCVRTDGRGGYLRYEFEYGDGVTTATDSLGGVHRFELNDRLQVVTLTDPLGAITRAEWDDANRPLSRTDPLGRVTRWSYAEPGQPAAVTRADGVREQEFDLDGLDRPRPARLPEGVAAHFGWTAEGDLLWRLGPNGSTQEWHYDGEGNLVEVFDAEGRAVSIEYGPFDLPVAQIDEAGNRTEFGYDTELRLTSVTNPGGAVWRYAYDAAGRLAEETDFDGRVQRYSHDAAGQLVAHTSAGGETTHYAYDVLGRVVERRIGEVVTRLEYDPEGRISTVTSPDAEVSFERDDRGRIIAETINGRTVRTSYDGDLVGTRVTPSGRSSRWTFDADGRPVALATGEHVVRFGHDAAGREISRTVDDAVALRQTFDAAGRLTTQHIAGTAERAFSYDAADRVTAITDSVAGDRAFDADPTGRIWDVSGTQSERYDYDEAGNLTGAGGGRWLFDGAMLMRTDDATFDYDDKGRLTGRTDTAGTWQFAWDAEDRLTEAVTPGGDRWRYRYDGFGRRIAKQRLADDGTVLEQVRFAWSGDLMVEQTGASTISWDYLPDGSAPVTQTDGDDLHTVITDVIGTPTHLVTSDGGLRWWSNTDLWGRSQDTAPTPLRFPGQYHDAETGLHYNRFRYYDPATARYLSPDPLGLAGGPNPTAYVPDPLTVADPLGLTSCKVAKPSLNPLAGTGPSPAVASDSEPSQLPTTATVPSPTALTGVPQVSPASTPNTSPTSDSQAQQWLADVAAAVPPTQQNSTLQDVQQQLPQLSAPNQNTATDGVVLGFLDDILGTDGRGKRTSTRRDTQRSSGRHHHSHSTRSRRSASPEGSSFAPERVSAPTRDDQGNQMWGGTRRGIGFYDNVRPDMIAALPAATVVIQSKDSRGRTTQRTATVYTAACGHRVEYSDIQIDHIEGIISYVNRHVSPKTWLHDLGNGYTRWVEGVKESDARAAANHSNNLRALCKSCNGGKRAAKSESKGIDTTGPQWVSKVIAPPSQAPSKFDTPRRKDYDDDQGGGAGFYSNQGGYSGGRSNDYYTQRGSSYVQMGGGNGTHSAIIDGQEVDLPPVSNLSQNPDGTWQADGKAVIQHPLTTRPGFALVSDADWAAMGQGTGIPADNSKNPDGTPKPPEPMVVVHGGDSVVAVPVREPDGSTSYLAFTSGQLDTMANYPNSALALASCRIGSPAIGTAGENFSSELAVQRNGDVFAPTVDIRLDSRNLWTADNTPWQLFTAGDLGTDGYDTFNDITPIVGISAEQGPDAAPNSDPGTAPTTDTAGDLDSDVATQVAPDAYPPTAPFTGVAPATVAKTTAETPTAGDPIDVTTGRMILTHTDAVLPGLTLERTYRSDYQWGRSFGRSWASTLDQRVIVDGDQVRYLAADGSVLTYPLPAEGDTALPAVGRALPLRRLLGGGWLLSDPTSGRSLVFAPATGTESLLSDVTDGGVRWSVDRDELGLPTRLRSSAGSTIGFDSFGDVVTELLLPDLDGTLVSTYEFGYNPQGELIEVVNSSGETERFSYLDGRIVQWEDRNGEWYTYDYDEAGRCVSTDGKGGYLRYAFDYQPGLTVVTDSVGAVRRYQLNDHLQVVEETDALGATTRREWDEAYRLRSEVDPLGRTTAYGYDAEGRRTTITRADGSTSTVAYDEQGRAVSWTDFDGSTRRREFDVDGRMLAETDADGMVVGFDLPTDNGTGTATQAGPTVVVRNAARGIVSMTTGDAETRYAYDSLGRVAGMVNDQGVTYFGWTPEGELAWRESPDGSLEEFVYDGEGNLIETLDATGRRTRREYGAFDMVTAQIDENDNRTEYAYDTELRLTTITNPAGETWQYTYDPNGRMVEETDFGGRTQRYAYDAAGQVVEHINAAGEVTTYTYDLLGQVIERRTGTAVTQLAYDPAGRIVSATDGESTVQLGRDALGRVVSETVNGNTVVTSYDERFGAVDARTRPSGAVTRWSYDESGRPAVLAAGDRQVRFGYTEGREVSRTSDAGLTLQQAYDDLGRLAAQRIEGVTDRRYTYDQSHRLIAVHDEVQGDRTVDPTGTGQPDAVRYTFDASGRPVTRSDGSGEWQFGWDNQNRLVAVSTPGGDHWLYRYDALGRRTVKQRVSAKGTALEEVTFTWSGDLLIEQQHRARGGQTTTTSWEYHPSLAHPIVQVTDGVVHAVVTDGDGVPMDLVGIDGGPAVDLAAIPVRSGGRYLDVETGLQYDRNRFYDPATDRFLQGTATAPAV